MPRKRGESHGEEKRITALQDIGRGAEEPRAQPESHRGDAAPMHGGKCINAIFGDPSEGGGRDYGNLIRSGKDHGDS